ncbi:unnamed protein product [Ectocarpus sp. 12 AP-2014]
MIYSWNILVAITAPYHYFTLFFPPRPRRDSCLHLSGLAVRPACYDLQLQIQVFTGHPNELHAELDACFAPKAQYVLSSCPARMTTNGIYLLYAWPTEDDRLATRFSPKVHSSEVDEVIASA